MTAKPGDEPVFPKIEDLMFVLKEIFGDAYKLIGQAEAKIAELQKRDKNEKV